jgi:ketosteroid isomerase-like protein
MTACGSSGGRWVTIAEAPGPAGYPLAVTHPHETLVRDAYGAFNEGDIDGFLVAFAEDAVLHGADGQIEGRDAIRSVVEQLRALTENTLHIEVHDVLANDNHTVILQLTKAKLGDRVLEDRVVYVFHIDDGFIVDAYFQGDPRVQEAFYSDA